MSTHPNAILAIRLTPDGLSRKTFREILEEREPKDRMDDDTTIEIAGTRYHSFIMEDDYHESWQVSAKEGDIVLLDMITYGYGATITWKQLDDQRAVLESWARKVCEKHNCQYEIFVTANYW
jgi:hypothetical protein